MPKLMKLIPFKIIYSHSRNKLQTTRFHKINTRPEIREKKNDSGFLIFAFSRENLCNLVVTFRNDYIYDRNKQK